MLKADIGFTLCPPSRVNNRKCGIRIKRDDFFSWKYREFKEIFLTLYEVVFKHDLT